MTNKNGGKEENMKKLFKILLVFLMVFGIVLPSSVSAEEAIKNIVYNIIFLMKKDGVMILMVWFIIKDNGIYFFNTIQMV